MRVEAYASAPPTVGCMSVSRHCHERLRSGAPAFRFTSPPMALPLSAGWRRQALTWLPSGEQKGTPRYRQSRIFETGLLPPDAAQHHVVLL